MTHYYGIEALCKRLGVKSYCGLRLQILRYHIPIYRRFCRHGKMKFARNILYSNDLLLMAWELEQVRAMHEDYQAADTSRLEGRRQAYRMKQGNKGLPCYSYRRQYIDTSKQAANQ